jgi:hypothetical protein
MQVADGERCLVGFNFDSVAVIARQPCLDALALFLTLVLCIYKHNPSQRTSADPQPLLGVKPTKLKPSKLQLSPLAKSDQSKPVCCGSKHWLSVFSGLG